MEYKKIKGGRNIREKMKDITGLMVYYYFVCKRKLWYFCNNINMEQNSELVALGKILDETSYKREKKGLLIDNTINIDFIKNGAMIHEIKKTKSIEEAGIWQTKYYIYYLNKKGIENVKAEIDYPLLKETKAILLEEEDKKILDKVVEEIKKIMLEENVPAITKKNICKKCSYYDLCYI